MAQSGVFVCGSPYTEVSTVAWALAAHPAFWTAPESRFLFQLFGSRPGMQRPYLYDAYLRCHEGGSWLVVNGVSYDEFLAALGSGISRLFQSRAGERRWVDSSPENALLGEDLLRMFPGSCVVGLLQPTRTVAFIWSRGQLENPDELEALAAQNRHYSEQLIQLAQSANGRVFLLEEGKLFRRPATAFAELLDFLGEPDAPAVAHVFASNLHRLGMNLESALKSLDEFSKIRDHVLTTYAPEWLIGYLQN